MPKAAASEMARVLRTASIAFLLAAVMTGCSEGNEASRTQEEASAAPPKAVDDHATTSEEREVQIDMVANDSGEFLEVDRMRPGQARGDIICETSADTNRIESCAYTPAEGFVGKDEFSYVVKDAEGRTDSATVHVRVKPTN